MKITRVEVRSVAPPVDRFTWSDDLPDQYATNTVVRILTDSGYEGVGGVWNATSYEFDRYTGEALRHLIPVLIGKNPLQREALRFAIRPRVFPIPPQALAAVDIALWDLAGKIAGLPLYQMLGGAREQIPAYASTPLFASVEQYLAEAQKFIDRGYRAVKFHTWCVPHRDLELARAVRELFPGDEVAFMLDAENNYDFDQALLVARELETMGFEWFEAPLHDSDLRGYRELTRRVGIPILPSGNWFQDLPSFTHATASGAWGRARTDAAAMGGITSAHQAITVAEAHGLKCEVMSWGYSLIACANLHLMLARNSCSYFEHSIPEEAYSYGMYDALSLDSEGLVHAPTGPGIGLSVDWAAMDAASLNTIVAE